MLLAATDERKFREQDPSSSADIAHNLAKCEAQRRCSIMYLVKEKGKEERGQPAREGSTLLPAPGSEVKIIQKNIARWLRYSCP